MKTAIATPDRFPIDIRNLHFRLRMALENARKLR